MAKGTMTRGTLEALIAKAFAATAATANEVTPAVQAQSLIDKLHAKQKATARELAVRCCC